MTILVSTVAQFSMLPAQPNTKRKAQDDNPLSNAAKKAKLEAKESASNKRKLLNAEEQPGGLRIIRAPNATPRQTSEPPSSNPNVPPMRPSSQSRRPPSSADAGPSRPTSKKFRSGSQPPASRTTSGSRSYIRGLTPSTQEDLDIEEDVRAMEDEADHLRRNSRAHTTIDSSVRLSTNPAFQFPPRPPDPDTPKGRSKTTDISMPLPSDDTPRIERNKRLREGAMAAITDGWSPAASNGREGGRGRKSSISSRGKRISTSFETTGVITQPHGSVSESSFYKHIDPDLPDAERMRQLLIWCSSRAAYGASSTPSKSRSAPQPEPEPPAEPLPPLSAQGVLLLKKAQEDVIRMLAERNIDLSLYAFEASGSGSGNGMDETLKENDQNVTNRKWEVTYKDHIQRAVEEDEAWKKVGYIYDAHIKKRRNDLEKRMSALQHQKERSTPSEKAKGKQKATELDDWRPRQHELSESFQYGVGLANSVLGMRRVGDERVAGSSRRHAGRGTGMTNEEMEAELDRRIPEVQFKVDHLYSFASAARATVDVIERTIDQRFELLSLHLAARSNPPPSKHDPGSSSGSGAQILSKYVKRDGFTGPDAMDVMRALARVDRERPPAMVGDAARRAAREVQRVGESGLGAIGERRLTGVPPSTPRKVPGTPRRGGTPGREWDRER